MTCFVKQLIMCVRVMVPAKHRLDRLPECPNRAPAPVAELDEMLIG